MIGAMIPSGITWIGDIPSEWGMKKVKYISTLKGRIGWQGLTSDEYMEEGAYLITGTDFDNGRINWETCVHVPMKRWEEAKDIQIENGDLLITKDGTVGKVAIVEGLENPCSLNSGVLRISTRSGYDRRFLFWVLQSEVFWTWFSIKNAGNSTILHLYQGDFAEFKYATPSLPEQLAIAAFLDARCGYIDGIIADLERQLEVLQQYKKALITETVTKGLDKSVPMKDSEVDWIGKMPKHWVIKRLKYCATITTGNTPSMEHEEYYNDEYGVEWIKPDNLLGLHGVSKSSIKLSLRGANQARIMPPNTILVCCIGSVGKFGYISESAAFNQQINGLIFSDDFYWKYGLYYMSVQEEQQQLMATGNVVVILNGENQKQLLIIVPSKKEQKAIADFLDTKCTETDALIAEKLCSVEIMRQYKQSLIYEYVTGKKRVAG